MHFRQMLFDLLFATPAGEEFDIRNTPFFSILCANPSLARIYADFFRRHGANPSLINDLEARSANFFTPDQSPNHSITKSGKGSNMAVNPNIRICTHIKVNGVRCGSPALRQEVFCYFHQRMIRGVRTPPKSRLHPIAMLENQESIQASLMEIVNALVRNQIDVARARLILRALSIAVRNAGKTHFEWSAHEMVKEVPEYPATPPLAGPFAIATAQAAALANVNPPAEQKSETELPASALKPTPEDARRKPPASVKSAPSRARTASPSRTG
jgi:hypothetical protein